MALCARLRRRERNRLAGGVCETHFAAHFPRPDFSLRFAFASIFAAVAGDMRPAFTACVARALAFAARAFVSTG